MEVTGKVVAVPPEKHGVSAKGPWRKVFVVVEYSDGQYPKQILLSNMKDAEKFAQLRVGQSGTFKFDCTVREGNGNYYMDVTCWSWQVNRAQEATDEPF